MSVSDFLIVFAACALTMLACRVLPVFLLKGRQLPETMVRALNFIPPAAFAALVVVARAASRRRCGDGGGHQDEIAGLVHPCRSVLARRADVCSGFRDVTGRIA